MFLKLSCADRSLDKMIKMQILISGSGWALGALPCPHAGAAGAQATLPAGHPGLL